MKTLFAFLKGNLTSGPLIPLMTSDTLPFGTVTSSAQTSPYYDWHVFDQNSNDFWLPGSNSVPQWVQYQFPYQVIVTSYTVSVPWLVSTMQLLLQASNNGSTWTTVDTFNINVTSTNFGYEAFSKSITATKPFSYWRVYWNSWSSSSANIAASLIQLYGVA